MTPTRRARRVEKRRFLASLIVLLRVSERLKIAMIPADTADDKSKKKARKQAKQVARTNLKYVV